MKPENLPAPLWRRLAAATYDAFLLLGLWLGLLLADEIFRGLLALPAEVHVLRVLLLGSAFVFFSWFWIHGGQTLGMRAWRLRVQGDDGAALTWPTAALRFAVALLSWSLLGLGLLWCLVDRRKRAWHDLAARTEVVLVAKPLSPQCAADTVPAP